VHFGFWNTYQSLALEIERYVRVLMVKYENATVTVTGASLGGALAVFTALELQAKTKRVTELYNYGAPRVGNREFAAYVDRTIPTRYRVTYRFDPVPHLPPRIMLYQHNSNEVFYVDDYKKRRVCNDSGEDDTCSNFILPPFWNSLDHFTYAHLGSDCWPIAAK
jgi:predicted lipase